MNRLLSILLIAITLLSACTSTKTLTNCPQFKGKQSNKHLAKAVNKKKNKRKKTQEHKAAIALKKEQKRAKRIERLTQKAVAKLQSKKMQAKLEKLPQKQVEKLYVLLSQLEQHTITPDDEVNLETIPLTPETPITPTVIKDKLVSAITNLEDLSSIQNKELVDIKTQQHLNNSPKIHNIKKANAKDLPIQEKSYKKQTQGFAIAALVCGIIGLLGLPFPFSILAIVFANVAKRKIREEPNLWSGEPMATTSMVLGIIGVAFLVIILGVFIVLLAAI